jgi:hypothetical protein
MFNLNSVVDNPQAHVPRNDLSRHMNLDLNQMDHVQDLEGFMPVIDLLHEPSLDDVSKFEQYVESIEAVDNGGLHFDMQPTIYSNSEESDMSERDEVQKERNNRDILDRDDWQDDDDNDEGENDEDDDDSVNITSNFTTLQRSRDAVESHDTEDAELDASDPDDQLEVESKKFNYVTAKGMQYMYSSTQIYMLICIHLE